MSSTYYLRPKAGFKLALYFKINHYSITINLVNLLFQFKLFAKGIT